MRHIACVQIDWLHLHVMGGGMVLGKIIHKVEFAFGPYNDEVALVDPIRHPVEPHVHGLGAFQFGALRGKSVGGGIVGDDSSCLLLLASQFFEYLSEEDCFLSVVEQGCNFGFRGCRDHMFEDTSFYVDGTVGALNFWGFIIRTQPENATNAGSCLGF